MEIDSIEMDNNEMEYNPLPEMIEPLSVRNYLFLTRKLPIQEFQDVKKGKFSNRVLKNISLDDGDDQSADSDDFEFDDQNIDFDDSDKKDFENDDYEEINFTSPDFDDDYNESKHPPNLNNDTYT